MFSSPVFVFDHALTGQEWETIRQNGDMDTNPVPVPAAGLLMARRPAGGRRSFAPLVKAWLLP